MKKLESFEMQGKTFRNYAEKFDLDRWVVKLYQREVQLRKI
jgi:hypothetical protein